MKKLFKALLAVIMVISCMVTLVACSSSKEKKVAIVKLGTHTSLDEIETTVEKRIKEKLGEIEIKKYDCNFDASLITQTMSALKDESNLTAVVAIATPVAQVAQSMLKKTPIIFAAVSDPVGAEVLKNADAPEANVTGVSDAVDVEKLIDLSLTVKPDTKTLGYIYTAGEANSLSNLAKIKAYAATKNLTVKEKAISNQAEIKEIANALLPTIDGLLVTDDNNVASGMVALSKQCKDAGVRMYCAADSEVKDGGMMGYSISYVKLGEFVGDMVADVANGKKIKNIPVKFFQSSDLSLFYNSTFTQGTSIEIPAAVLANATDLASAE